MKFSVLLPTRNRLQYLHYAVESVRRQSYEDWEIIISDNFSDEDIAGYIRSLDEPRIKYYRTDRFLPVTENWNNALEKSTGDYVIMLGDDDGLMQGFFRRLSDLIGQFGQPDFIYTGAYLFAYPNVFPAAPEGFMQSYDYASFLEGMKEPYLLPKDAAEEVVRAAFDFRVVYGFNMQFATIRRGFIEELSTGGPFYEPPFPDYYAMNVMFLKAKKILICPDLLVAIGVTPKSYGFYHNNNQEDSGMEFLNGTRQLEVPAPLARTLLPGTNINTSWLLSLEKIRQRYPTGIPFGISYQRYRLLQTLYVFKGYYLDKSLPVAVLQELKKQMHWWERLSLYPVLSLAFGWVGRCSKGFQDRVGWRMFRELRQFPNWRPSKTISGYQNLLEAFDKADPFQR